jgi:hypothetical protein
VPADGVGERREQRGGLADPVGEGGAVEIEPIALEDLALAIERQVVGVLADQHMREQARAGATTLDGTQRQRRLDEALAAGTGQPRADDPVHDEAAGDVFQLLGHVLADPAQPAASVGAGIGCRAELHLHPRDVGRGSDGASAGRSPSMSGRRSRAAIATAAMSLVSSASCRCSAVSDEVSERIARLAPGSGIARMVGSSVAKSMSFASQVGEDMLDPGPRRH